MNARHTSTRWAAFPSSSSSKGESEARAECDTDESRTRTRTSTTGRAGRGLARGTFALAAALALAAGGAGAQAPVLTESARLLASDGFRGQEFARSVALAGDLALVGAQYDEDLGYRSGCAYVFVRNGPGAWSQGAKLTAADGVASDFFGCALSGDRLVAGAYGTGASRGAAYLYELDLAVGRHAYAANAGWVNFAPAADEGVAFGDYFLSGYAYAANFGWIHFGNGQPANGIRYGNASNGDYGVNHDGLGNLSGHAHGANVGWINFGWADAADPDRPRVDLATGTFSGYAYGANIGWLNLGTGLQTLDMFSLDFDGDGLGDAWERERFGNLTAANGSSNADGDPATDIEEHGAGTDPNDPDDCFTITAMVFGDGWTMADVTFTSVPGRLYRIESCAKLGGEWEGASPGVFAPDAGATTTRTVVWPGSSSRFIRVVVLIPLQAE